MSRGGNSQQKKVLDFLPQLHRPAAHRASILGSGAERADSGRAGHSHSWPFSSLKVSYAGRVPGRKRGRLINSKSWRRYCLNWYVEVVGVEAGCALMSLGRSTRLECRSEFQCHYFSVIADKFCTFPTPVSSCKMRVSNT